MKHEIISLNTKKMLASSLKKLLESKPLPKVTVSEIITDCKVNRKTFYYHFENVYALLNWMLKQEAIEVIKQMDLITDYEETIYFVLDYIDENEIILKNIYHFMGKDELLQFFHQDFIELSATVIEKAAQKNQINVNREFKDLLSRFYTGAIASLLLERINSKSPHDREKIVQYISLILNNSITNILIAAGSENP
ncbi:MAG: TetR family transcriptional regulator C-terminal domain-containing protein [Lachnospiraceae bacterium]|nr:TetR family transcriptional regulator C-terminal domain-containing protein [Lachnospiraceae bacterium]